MKIKTEFVYIEPKNTNSKLTFEIDFKGLHSCKVLERTSNKLFVKSIAGEYYFWIDKDQDPNWSLIK